MMLASSIAAMTPRADTRLLPIYTYSTDRAATVTAWRNTVSQAITSTTPALAAGLTAKFHGRKRLTSRAQYTALKDLFRPDHPASLSTLDSDISYESGWEPWQESTDRLRTRSDSVSAVDDRATTPIARVARTGVLSWENASLLEHYYTLGSASLSRRQRVSRRPSPPAWPGHVRTASSPAVSIDTQYEDNSFTDTATDALLLEHGDGSSFWNGESQWALTGQGLTKLSTLQWRQWHGTKGFTQLRVRPPSILDIGRSTRASKSEPVGSISDASIAITQSSRLSTYASALRPVLTPSPSPPPLPPKTTSVPAPSRLRPSASVSTLASTRSTKMSWLSTAKDTLTLSKPKRRPALSISAPTPALSTLLAADRLNSVPLGPLTECPILSPPLTAPPRPARPDAHQTVVPDTWPNTLRGDRSSSQSTQSGALPVRVRSIGWNGAVPQPRPRSEDSSIQDERPPLEEKFSGGLAARLRRESMLPSRRAGLTPPVDEFGTWRMSRVISYGRGWSGLVPNSSIADARASGDPQPRRNRLSDASTDDVSTSYNAYATAHLDAYELRRWESDNHRRSPSWEARSATIGYGFSHTHRRYLTAAHICDGESAEDGSEGSFGDVESPHHPDAQDYAWPEARVDFTLPHDMFSAPINYAATLSSFPSAPTGDCSSLASSGLTRSTTQSAGGVRARLLKVRKSLRRSRRPGGELGGAVVVHGTPQDVMGAYRI